MQQIDVTEDYIAESGVVRNPSAGEKFIWARVQLKNIGQTEVDAPLLEHFSMLYAATEFKPTYGHRQGYAEYSTLAPVLFPNQAADGWMRFDIPVTAELKDLRFVFLPESSHVGASFSAPNYPYAEDKPTYVWNCAP